MKKKILALMIVSTMAITCVACGNKTSSNKADTPSTESIESISVIETDEYKTQDIKVEELNELADNGVITGIKNIMIEKGTDVDLNDLVYADKTIVKSVDVDDSKVDYNEAGTYEVTYTITFDGDNLRSYIKVNNLKESFDTEGDNIIVKTTVTITVATKEETESAIANGDTSVVTEENKESVKSENKTKANDNAVASKPSESDNNNFNNNNSSKKNDNYQNNGNANNNDNNNGSDNNVSTEKTHIHSWDGGTVTTQATCTTDGIKTYSCSCGETKTENISALGHDMVHYDATSHSEQKLVKEAWTETIYDERYVCTDCGTQFTSNREAGKHIASSDNCHNYSLETVPIDTKYHEAQYETVQVSDNNAYDVCTRCGYKN